ncbi:MAG: hypothetical protein RL328_2094 [Acidobacteriota bacterium]|jgi:hypothetical protein
MKLLAAALLFAIPALPQSLDFETYRTKVEPIFLKKRPTHARCIVCHEGNRTAFRLQPLAEGAATWTAEQSKQNYDNIVRLVINKQNPGKSALLLHPLAEAGGGDDFHSGGRQFATKNDPEWKILADWVMTAK